MRKKFKVVDASNDEKVKLKEGEMIVMNGDGVLFVVSGIGDYYTYIRRLSDVVPKYDVVWKE